MKSRLESLQELQDAVLDEVVVLKTLETTARELRQYSASSAARRAHEHLFGCVSGIDQAIGVVLRNERRSAK